jgi:hypothetical protein
VKVSKRQLRRIIREEKRRLVREQAKDDMGRYLPNPQFPKMTYPEDRAKAAADKGDLYVNLTDEQADALDSLEAAAAACSKAGCTRADVMDTVSGFNLK